MFRDVLYRQTCTYAGRSVGLKVLTVVIIKVTVFQTVISSGWNRREAHFSKTLMPIYKITRCHFIENYLYS